MDDASAQCVCGAHTHQQQQLGGATMAVAGFSLDRLVAACRDMDKHMQEQQQDAQEHLHEQQQQTTVAAGSPECSDAEGDLYADLRQTAGRMCVPKDH